MCSEVTSPPRVSFSYDMGPRDVVTVESIIKALESDSFSASSSCPFDSSSEFEFSFTGSSEQQSCSADELFANGVILPAQMVRQRSAGSGSTAAHGHEDRQQPLRSIRSPAMIDETKKKESSAKEIITVSSLEAEEKPVASKSFWGFKRSASLNSDGVQRKSLISLLSRSNSTGSVPNPKKVSQKQHPSIALPKSSSSSSSSNGIHSWPQKPPLKKNHGQGVYYGHGAGARVSPVLNMPTPFAANFLGLGSLLKDKKIRR